MRNHLHNGEAKHYDATAYNRGGTFGNAQGVGGHLDPFMKFSAYLRTKARWVKRPTKRDPVGVKVVAVDAIAADTLRGLAPLPSTVHERRQVVNYLVDCEKMGIGKLGKLGSREVFYMHEDSWLRM